MSNLGYRLRQARKIADLSLRDLADFVHLSHTIIKKYEDGNIYPCSNVLIKLAKALGVRVDFFFRPITTVSLKHIKFRKRKELTTKAQNTIKFKAINQIENRLELENLYPYPRTHLFELPPNLPAKVSNFEEIESIVEDLRQYWKLGFSPISNLINFFENQGIRVFIIETEEEHFDAFSTVIDNQPIIVISSKWPGDRQRLNLLHELAHYIFYKRISSSLDEEKVCNRFAGAFLFPRKAIFQIVGEKRQAIKAEELLVLKEQFQLSMSAISYRLKELKIIHNACYKKLMDSLREKGWDKEEPTLEISQEKNHIFKQMIFRALAEEYIGETKAAELLFCPLDQLQSLY